MKVNQLMWLFPPGKAQLLAVNEPIGKIEPDLIESVTSYVTGLKNPRKPIPERSRRMARISWGIIGLTMISLMAVMVWSGTSVNVTAEPVPPDLEVLSSFIETISSDAVVLVGMEYDLPLAGEIENAALPVLADLMVKQVNLVFLSTHPVGPAMSSHLIELGRNWQPDYPVDKTFIFTYLPGGATGLLRFAIAPREALPVAANGTRLWFAPQLSSIYKPSDFSMLLLLTDSSEAAKDWLEQVQPRMREIPIFVIASNQAVPVLQPYFKSGQIKTLVGGISGAASYEKVHLVTTNNQILLRAYNSGLLFMAILLACIIILSIITPRFQLRSRSKRQGNASK